MWQCCSCSCRQGRRRPEATVGGSSPACATPPPGAGVTGAASGKRASPDSVVQPCTVSLETVAVRTAGTSGGPGDSEAPVLLAAKGPTRHALWAVRDAQPSASWPRDLSPACRSAEGSGALGGSRALRLRPRGHSAEPAPAPQVPRSLGIQPPRPSTQVSLGGQLSTEYSVEAGPLAPSGRSPSGLPRWHRPSGHLAPCSSAEYSASEPREASTSRASPVLAEYLKMKAFMSS